MQLILVGVASLLVFESQIDQIRFAGGRFKLKNFCFYELRGTDAEFFLQNFLTCNLKNLSQGEFTIGARLNIQARLQLYTYVIKQAQNFTLMLPNSFVGALEQQFEKYIIAEDVEYKKSENINAYMYFDPADELKQPYIKGCFLGEPVKLIFQDDPISGFEKIQPFALKTLSYLSGWPIGDEEFNEEIINTLFLNEIAVDYSKGCFLGQETAAKIHNNRGAATYPLIISCGDQIVDAIPGEKIFLNEVEIGKVRSLFMEKDETFLCADVKREWRIDKQQLEVKIKETELKVTINLYPFFSSQTNEEKSKELLEVGLELFQEDDLESSKVLIEQAIKLSPLNSDAVESLGVILGREGNFESAIDQMNRLLEIDPFSVMAHTNKSLYLMKLGRIEEAEEEKAQATVKTFEKLGREAKEKRDQAEKADREREELVSRMKMFEEVLEIDEFDEFANIQLASIHIKLGEFGYIKSKFEFLLENFPNNPETYVVLVKYLHQSQSNPSQLSELIKIGKEVAAKKGNQKALSELNAL